MDKDAAQAAAQAKKKYTLYNSIFGSKELFDRLSYGFGGYQFITILFYLTGAGAFIVSLITALRDVCITFLSSLLHDYSKVHTVGKQFISNAGIFYGFSFFGILLALRLESVALFAFSLLVGSFGVVTHGELFLRLRDNYIPHERRSGFLQKASHYGLVITAVAFFVAGVVLELFQADKATEIFGMTINVSGAFILVEVTAILCIISGYLLSLLPNNLQPLKYPFKQFRIDFMRKTRHQMSQFLDNKYLVLLLVAGIGVSIVQNLGAALYGYHIYTSFLTSGLGGFINIGLIFTVAIIVSFMGPWLAHFLKKHIGLAPLFVFASLLMGMLPLAFIFNPYFTTILVATSLSVLGASIIGVSQGLLVRKLLYARERNLFFQVNALLTLLPVLIVVPIGGYLAQTQGFIFVFTLLLGLLLFVVAPLYLLLVLMSHRKRL